MKHIEPFIWRKYLDFAAIKTFIDQAADRRAQVAANRRQRSQPQARPRWLANRVFTQTQQLIWGGRSPRLRVAPTLAALASLVQAGRTSAAAATDLTAAYGFLRRAEHRLQMIADAQTHSLPSDDAAVAGFAAFLGYSTVATFQGDLLRHLNTVAQRYGALFEEAPAGRGPGDGTRPWQFGLHRRHPAPSLWAMGFDDGEAVAMQIPAPWPLPCDT